MVTISCMHLCIHDGDGSGRGMQIKPGEHDHDGWQAFEGLSRYEFASGGFATAFKSFDLKSLSRGLSWAPTSLRPTKI